MRRSLLTSKVSGRTSAAYSVEVLADSPRVWWRFNETSGTTAADSSGNSRNGTYIGSPTLGITGLLIDDPDKAVGLDGVNDRITYSGAVTAAASSFTVEIWARPSGVSGYPFRVLDGTTGAVIDLVFVVVGGSAQFRADFDGPPALGAKSLSSPLTITAGTPYHVVVTWDNPTDVGRLYVNGVQVASDTVTGTGPTFNSIIVGARGTSVWFGGGADEFAVYPTALSAARILAHYQSGIGL